MQFYVHKICCVLLVLCHQNHWWMWHINRYRRLKAPLSLPVILYNCKNSKYPLILRVIIFVGKMLFVEFCKTFSGNEKAVTIHVFYNHFTNITHKTCGLQWSLNNGLQTCLETIPVLHENWYQYYGRMKISFVFRSLVTANGLSVARTQTKGKQELHKTMACLCIKINIWCDPNHTHVLALFLRNIHVLVSAGQNEMWHWSAFRYLTQTYMSKLTIK